LSRSVASTLFARFATEGIFALVEMEVGVRAHEAIGVRGHDRTQRVELGLLLLRGRLPVSPSAPTADGMEVDPDGNGDGLCRWYRCHRSSG